MKSYILVKYFNILVIILKLDVNKFKHAWQKYVCKQCKQTFICFEEMLMHIAKEHRIEVEDSSESKSEQE